MRIQAPFSFFVWILCVRGHILKGWVSSYDMQKQQAAGPRNSLGESDDVSVEGRDISEAEENLGKNYFEGDILTTHDQMVRLNQLLDPGTAKLLDPGVIRGITKEIDKTWDDGVVYFTIPDNVGCKKRKIIKQAIDHWQEKTCLCFKKRTNEADYIEFKKASGCSSYVGRKEGKQTLKVGDFNSDCELGNIIHEIGHAVGIYHEMTRPDRDEYVKINWKNIEKDNGNGTGLASGSYLTKTGNNVCTTCYGYERNFRKLSTNEIDSRNVTYDYGSIMHYGRHFFSKDRRKATIVPLKKTDAKLGQRVALSKSDILQARMLYNCDKKKDTGKNRRCEKFKD